MKAEVLKALHATRNYPVKLLHNPHKKGQYKVKSWYSINNSDTNKLHKQLQKHLPEIKSVYNTCTSNGEIHLVINTNH